MGVLFATGMLILFPAAGWAVLVGVAARLAYGRWRGAAAQGEMEVFAGGVIAGDAMTGFFNGVRASFK